MRLLKHYFIPHQENGYNPHFFRNTCILFLAIVTVAMLSLSLIGNRILKEQNLLSAIYASVLVDLANEDRDITGLPALKVSSVLESVASMKAKDMAEKGYFAHTSPEGLNPWHWFGEAGYKFIYAGENLAVNFTESDAVEKAWMASPTHRANILNRNFTEIGIAVEEGVFQGRKTIFVVQAFGKPAFTAYASEPAQPQVAVTPAPVAEPEVQGAELQVIEDTASPAGDNLFIAVKDAALEENVEIVNEMSAPAPEERTSTIFERLALRYPLAIQIAYVLLASIVSLALIFLILVEIRIQHPRSILAGCLLLALIALSFYANSQSELFQLASLL